MNNTRVASYFDELKDALQRVQGANLANTRVIGTFDKFSVRLGTKRVGVFLEGSAQAPVWVVHPMCSETADRFQLIQDMPLDEPANEAWARRITIRKKDQELVLTDRTDIRRLTAFLLGAPLGKALDL